MSAARKDLFSRALAAAPSRLHMAAHSHHLWPDVTLAAQVEAWEDAVVLADHKWDKVMGQVYPAAQGLVARELGLAAKRVELAVGGQHPHGPPADRRNQPGQQGVGVGREDHGVGRR